MSTTKTSNMVVNTSVVFSIQYVLTTIASQTAFFFSFFLAQVKYRMWAFSLGQCLTIQSPKKKRNKYTKSTDS